MIFLFTDFGRDGPYVGQMTAAVLRTCPQARLIDLCHDLPPFAVKAAAFLLPAYTRDVGRNEVVVAVVDPGVGTERAALVLEADGRWFVGPDNGLLSIVARRAGTHRVWTIGWQPPALSRSFHGRDLFAPVAARLAEHGAGALDGLGCRPASLSRPDWPEDLAEVVYIDRYGNAMTGIRAEAIGRSGHLVCRGQPLRRAATFGEVAPGVAFWYENANGLAEIAVNQGDAANALGLSVGVPIGVAANNG
jgi:S-adenosylmethionine hydrolase